MTTRSTTTRRRLGAATLGVGLALLAFGFIVPQASAVVTNPTFVDGANPKCDDVEVGGFPTDFKIDQQPPDGDSTWTTADADLAGDVPASLVIEISNLVQANDTVTFDWSATVEDGDDAGTDRDPFLIDRVLVKASTGANMWTYDPPASSGTGLYSPKDSISHINFCFGPHEGGDDGTTDDTPPPTTTRPPPTDDTTTDGDDGTTDDGTTDDGTTDDGTTTDGNTVVEPTNDPADPHPDRGRRHRHQGGGPARHRRQRLLADDHRRRVGARRWHQPHAEQPSGHRRRRPPVPAEAPSLGRERGTGLVDPRVAGAGATAPILIGAIWFAWPIHVLAGRRYRHDRGSDDPPGALTGRRAGWGARAKPTLQETAGEPGLPVVLEDIVQ